MSATVPESVIVRKEHFVDYNIHGLVGIRLLNPTASDEAVVARQLGPMLGSFEGKPEITIRFVKDLHIGDLHYLGMDKVGYNDTDFFILRSSKRNAKVKLAFDKIGGALDIICESGLRSVPLLLDILNLTLLNKEVVALHASAFVFHDTGVIVTGWAKGGKTEALLSFARHGAEYVGDEWIYLPADGSQMYGIPENIRLWDWHLDNLPHLKGELGFEKKALFGTIHGLDALQKSLPRNGFGGLMPIKFLREAMPAFRRQLNVQLPPDTIFKKCSPTFSARPDKVFLLLSCEDDKYSVEQMKPEQVAKQMVSSLQFESVRFMEHYQAFKFAFPDKVNPFIENASKLQHALLTRALTQKEAYAVRHPYPLSFERLYETMLPFVSLASVEMLVNSNLETETVSD